MKIEVYRRNVDTQDKLLACILVPAARIKKREDQLRRTKRDLRTRTARCIVEAESEIFEYLS